VNRLHSSALAFVLAIAAPGAGAAPAQTFPAVSGADIQSVIGLKRKDADLRMKQQGYIKKNVTELEDGGSSYVWWNRDTHECLRVVAKDSKIKNVKSSKKESCD
jgi:hypothetical protein